MSDTTSVVLVGLGATGLALGQAFVRRGDCDVVGAADVAPSRVGHDLGVLLGGPPMGMSVVGDIAELPPADLAVVATTSALAGIEPTLAGLVQRGMYVVSICEELSHPHLSHPDVVARLDELAVDHGVSVLGTGANPGMIMDTLPILLSSLTQRVSRVRIRRTADMSHYGAILTKFGLGLTEEEFRTATDAGTVIGHVGFEQSIAAIADGLGWTLDEIVVDKPEPAVIAAESRRGDHVEVGPGTIAAILHGGRGVVAGEAVIELATHFGFIRDGDPVEAGDACIVEGEEQTVEVRVPGGYESFLSTVAVASNVATAVVAADPGFRTMADLPVGAVASKGAARG
jgi:4-hydroxy-tetrahydrodipicolinate reductase